MSASASTQVIIMCVHRQQPVCLSTFITKVCVLRACPPKPNVHTCLYCLRPLHACICQSSTQALCGVDNNLNICHLYIHVCIGFNSSQYLMCTSTSLCAWAWCTYIPALPSPLACVCTSIVNQALCGIDNNLNINCHIIHHLYWHLHTCQHHLPSKWTSCVYKSMHIHTTKSLSNKASMVKYVHVSICAFDPSTNASMHVNRQHNALSTITCVHKCQHRLQSKCVYIDNNLYVYVHLQQKSVSCVHVHQSLMYVHACIVFNPCMCV